MSFVPVHVNVDSNTGKKGSQSSLDFGRGERRSPSPSVASQGDGTEMLKHVASGGSARTGDLGSGTNVKLPQVRSIMAKWDYTT